MSNIFSLFKQISSKSQALTGSIEYVIVGLGNPGAKYNGTRHNVGFETLDIAADKLNIKINKIKFKSLCGEAMIARKRVLFLKPSTYMNLSGQAVVEVLNFYKLDAAKLIIIADDVSLAPGDIRIRVKGSAGGHNGFKNIIQLTGRDDFLRIKIGVGKKPHPDYDLADWVTEAPKGEDREKIKDALDRAYQALEPLVEGDVVKAMNLFNSVGSNNEQQ